MYNINLLEIFLYYRILNYRRLGYQGIRMMWKNKVRSQFIMVYGLILLIIMLLFLNTLSVLAESNDNLPKDENYTRSRSETHAVFAEYFTTGWCQYCPSASAELKRVYTSGDYEFYFVSMIIEDAESNQISQDARDRANEFSISSYPMVEFDGGYIEVSGGQSDDTNYRNAIEYCDQREIPDIDLELTATHKGEAIIDLSVNAINNEDSSYSGTLRVYIAEIVSRYLNYDGDHCTFGFIDFAIDTTVDIASGQTTTESTTWDGATVTDDLGNNFGDIQEDNIIVFATISTTDRATLLERHTQSSKAPNLYFTDETAAAYLTEGSLDDRKVPSVEIVEPYSNDIVSDKIRIDADVTDDGTIAIVEYSIDETEIWTRLFPEGSIDDRYFGFWDTSIVADGLHTITVRAIDAAQNIGEDSVFISVSNYGDDNIKPVIVFRDVKEAQEVVGTFSFSVEVTDDSDIESVRYNIDDGSWNNMRASGFNKYKAEFETRDYSDGEQTINVEAKDRAGNIKSEAISIKILNNPPESSSDKGFIPGFEGIILIGAILITLFLFSKKSNKRFT
jgi:hypothetical protein